MEDRNLTDLQDLEIYCEAMEIGEVVWKMVSSYSSFAHHTLGNQFVRSTDSIAANIAEGYGRYHHKENLKFCYYARGSLRETECWLTKSVKRGLIDRDTGKLLFERLVCLRKRLNAYITSIRKLT